VDADTSLTITGTYNAAGGSISGPGYLSSASLQVTASPASPTTILVGGTGVTLTTDNLPNTIIWAQGNNAFNAATLNMPNGVTNPCTTRLQSADTNWTCSRASGINTFTNAADGVIEVNQGTAGPRSLTGNVINQGAVNVGAGTTLTVNGPTSANFINQG